LALACGGERYLASEPGNPLPPAEAITGGEFAFGPDLQASTARRVTISGDRVVELRRLFDRSRIDPEPARWVILGDLKLALKGGGSQVYTIYLTRKGPGAFSDHLRRYFRGGSDGAFLEFLAEAENAAKLLPPAPPAK
jgi:hypothetical protein